MYLVEMGGVWRSHRLFFYLYVYLYLIIFVHVKSRLYRNGCRGGCHRSVQGSCFG